MQPGSPFIPERFDQLDQATAAAVPVGGPCATPRGPVVGPTLTPDEIQAAILKAALAPASVTIDGNSATARSAVDLVALLNLAAARTRLACGRPPMRTFRLIPPGTVGPPARPY